MKLFSIELLNNAEVYGGPFSTPRGHISDDGVVTLHGLIAVPQYGLIGRVPEHARPDKNILLDASTGYTGKVVRLDIQANGEIIVQSNNIEDKYVSLSGLTYLSKNTKVSQSSAVSAIARRFAGGIMKAQFSHKEGTKYSIQVFEVNNEGLTATFDWFLVDSLTGDFEGTFTGTKGNIFV